MSAPTPIYIYIVFIMIPSGPSIMELSSRTSAAVTKVHMTPVFFEKIAGVRLCQGLKVAANASLSYYYSPTNRHPLPKSWIDAQLGRQKNSIQHVKTVTTT
jgi:hypothetical protein